MARIVQSLTQPTEKYDQTVQQSFVRDVDSICLLYTSDAADE